MEYVYTFTFSLLLLFRMKRDYRLLNRSVKWRRRGDSWRELRGRQKKLSRNWFSTDVEIPDQDLALTLNQKSCSTVCAVKMIL